MAVELYPDLFQNFFHEMTQPKSLNDGFQSAFELLEHPLHIGKVSVSFAPRRPGMVSGLKNANLKTDVFLSKFSFNSEVSQNYQFIWQDEIIVGVTIYATTSCDQWSMKQLPNLAMIAETTFVFASRLRSNDIASANALTDTLTGLPNYVSFCSTGRSLCTLGTIGRYTAILINIKNFNDINLKYSFVMGDQVLRKFSAFLQTGMLPEETVARHGGDSFVMLVKNDRAEDIAAKVRSTTITAVNFDASELHLNIESDVTAFKIPEDTKDFNYCLKELSSIVQTHILTSGSAEIKRAEADMSAFSAELKSGCYSVFYQPKVSMEDGSMIGAEALIRKTVGEDILLPADFLPELSKDQRICLLDYYVLDQVCQDLLDWIAEGKATLVSVNFSSKHIDDEGFVDRITNIIDRYGIDPSYIEIEFTELPDVNDFEKLKTFIDQMHANDLTVSVDDIGCGSASLLALTELGFDAIRIDKDLSIKAGNATADRIIRHFYNLATDLNMEVIAEGIETEEQAKYFKELGCVTAQGYLYDKPMNKNDFEKKLS